MKKLLVLLVALCVALCAFTACGGGASSSQPEPEPEVVYNPDPFTGLEKAADYHDGQRPLAVMINNIWQALPQSGLADADVTVEMVTEGGITRLMCVYSDYTRLSGVNIGPVRSARDQHIQLMMPWKCLYMHIGASTPANLMLDEYLYRDKEVDGNYQSVRDFCFYFDTQRWQTRDSEHCWYTNGDLIMKAIEEYELDTGAEPAPIFKFVSYHDTPRVLTDGPATAFEWDFSDYEHAAMTYDETQGRYMKYEFGVPQTDDNLKAQVGYDNVLVLFSDITLYPDSKLAHVEYAFGGFGFYFCDGRYEAVRWTKGIPLNALHIVDAAGNETDVEINPGTTYIAMVDYSHYDAFTASFLPADTGSDSATAGDSASGTDSSVA